MEIFNETEHTGFIEMNFCPLWDYIPFIREYIHNIMTLYCQDSKDVEKITLAVSEILENAVKYSIKLGVRMILENLKGDLPMRLSVYNFAEPNHAKRLLESVEKMNGAEPLAFYIEKMRASVEQEEGQANIGLARIYYESGAKINAAFVEEGLMKISVEFNDFWGGENHA